MRRRMLPNVAVENEKVLPFATQSTGINIRLVNYFWAAEQNLPSSANLDNPISLLRRTQQKILTARFAFVHSHG